MAEGFPDLPVRVVTDSPHLLAVSWEFRGLDRARLIDVDEAPELIITVEQMDKCDG